MSETPLDPGQPDEEAPEHEAPEPDDNPKQGINDPEPEGTDTDEPLTSL